LKTNETRDREKITIWLDKDQIAYLRRVADAEDKPVSAQIRRLISEAMKKG
jgi:hypothetical protein